MRPKTFPSLLPFQVPKKLSLLFPEELGATSPKFQFSAKMVLSSRESPGSPITSSLPVRTARGAAAPLSRSPRVSPCPAEPAPQLARWPLTPGWQGFLTSRLLGYRGSEAPRHPESAHKLELQDDRGGLPGARGHRRSLKKFSCRGIAIVSGSSVTGTSLRLSHSGGRGATPTSQSNTSEPGPGAGTWHIVSKACPGGLWRKRRLSRPQVSATLTGQSWWHHCNK